MAPAHDEPTDDLTPRRDVTLPVGRGGEPKQQLPRERYELGEQLGHGGMGIVYRAWDRELKRDLAVKVFKPGAGRGERFAREAQAAARLRHPNVVTVHDLVLTPQGTPDLLVMELLPGETLSARLRTTGPLDEGEALRVGVQLAEALAYAHAQGVIHRDVKPENVLLPPDGRAVLADFGLARIADQSEQLTRTGQVLGTPSFMPPEQIRGQREVIEPRSDVYSLGATLYVALCGRDPFPGATTADVLKAVLEAPPPNVRSHRPELSPEIAELCVTCLAKHPRDRPSAVALAVSLRALLEAGPLQRTPRARLVSAGALLLIVLVALAGAPLLLRPAPAPPADLGRAALPPEAAALSPEALREKASRLPPAEVVTLLKGPLAAPLTSEERAAYRSAARARALEELIAQAQADLPLPDLVEALRVVQQLSEPNAAPERSPAADEVLARCRRAELLTPERLSDPLVSKTVESLGAAGLKPTALAARTFLAEAHFSSRPQAAEFQARYLVICKALARLDVPIRRSELRALHVLSARDPDRGSSPLEVYLHFRVRFSFDQLSQAEGRAFVQSEAFAALSPTNQALCLIDLADTLDANDPERVSLFSRALKLAPELRLPAEKLGTELLIQAIRQIEVDPDRARELFARASPQLQRATEHRTSEWQHEGVSAFSAVGSHAALLENVVAAHVWAGRPELARSLIERFPTDSLPRQRLEAIAARTATARAALGW